MKHRIFLALVYGAQSLDFSPPRGSITWMVKSSATSVYCKEAKAPPPTVDDPVVVEVLGIPQLQTAREKAKLVSVKGKAPSKSKESCVWALVTLPASSPKNLNLFAENRVRIEGQYGKAAVIMIPFPWELPNKQHFRIGWAPATTTEEDVREEAKSRLEDRILSEPSISRSLDSMGKNIWNMTLVFRETLVEDQEDPQGRSMMGTLERSERTWQVKGDMWQIWAGTHCRGCHGSGHTDYKCPMQPYVTPYDHFKSDQLPKESSDWPIEVFLNSHPNLKVNLERDKNKK